MAPTICSGKKRPTHTVATTNIQRRDQGSHQLNQALSNIVNFVATGSTKPRVSTSLRIRTHKPMDRNTNATVNCRNTNHEADLNYSHNLTTQINTTLSSRHRCQQFSFISDNAVTSSTHSDTENSFDLRLTNETLTNDSTATYCSNTNTTNPSDATSLTLSPLSQTSSSSSASTHKEKTPSSTLQCQERSLQRYSKIMQTNNMAGNDEEDDSDNEERDLYENDNKNKINSNIETSEIRHSSNIRNHCFSCNGFYLNDDGESENGRDGRELNSDMSCFGSDADMDTDESDSMTSFDTEKSAKLKSGNHPLLRDKLLAKQQSKDSSSNTKPFDNIRNTDGLLSIAIKTIKLVKRNQMLQQRLTQLQLETSEFIQSVLANPENRHFRENIKQEKVDNV